MKNDMAVKTFTDYLYHLCNKNKVNLKNIYDLFMSLKGDVTEDDPMFTAKGLFCSRFRYRALDRVVEGFLIGCRGKSNQR